jgi:CRP/FNR family transcriptional regulator
MTSSTDRRPLSAPLPPAVRRESGLPAPCAACAARTFSICAPLDPEAQGRFFAMAARIRLDARKLLFQEGDAADHVFNVTEGAVCVSKALADGRRQITGFLLPGDFLGLSRDEIYAYSAETLTAANLCKFPRERFQRFLGENPHMEHRLLGMASNELAAAQDQMLLLGRKTAIERVASFLVSLSDRGAARGRPASPLPVPMTRGEIADYLGLTIETVSRAFTRLRKQGLIVLETVDLVRIPDLENLRDLAIGG